MDIFYPKNGINWRLPAWHPEMLERMQCVNLQNLRVKDDSIDTILGTRKFHGTSLGSDPITGILPYYNDQTDDFRLFAACGDSLYYRDEALNEFVSIKSGLTPNKIFSSAIRHGVMYIASGDGLFKYLGGSKIEGVGGGQTKPGSFRQVIYMKEIDRLFGISDDAVFGQITWCDLSQPEIWDGANVERIKLKDGERVEGADILFGKLIIFCTYTIWIYYVSGNEENWKLEEAPTGVGCVAPNTIKRIGSEIWFLGESPKHELGVYAFNGSNSKLLTYDIGPLFRARNKNKIRNACAEVFDDIYTVSWAHEASETNNISVDLDTVNMKEDGTPAIYGPHTRAFYSSCVLNTRQNNGQLLLGDQSDGFVYWANGSTLKSTDGTNGSLLQQKFTSAIHNEKSWLTMKRYEKIYVYFRPRSFWNARILYYLSNGSYGEQTSFVPSVQTSSQYGDFNIYEDRVYAIPDLSMAEISIGGKGRGTSIQIEIINDNLAQRIAFQGYGYSQREIYNQKGIETYAL